MRLFYYSFSYILQNFNLILILLKLEYVSARYSPGVMHQMHQSQKLSRCCLSFPPLWIFLNARIYERQPKFCFRSRKRFIPVSSSSQPSKEFHPGQEQRTRESFLLPGKSGGTHLMTQKHPLQSTLAHFNTTIQFLEALLSCLRTRDKQFSSAGSTVCRGPGQKLTGGPSAGLHHINHLTPGRTAAVL